MIGKTQSINLAHVEESNATDFVHPISCPRGSPRTFSCRIGTFFRPNCPAEPHRASHRSEPDDGTPRQHSSIGPFRVRPGSREPGDAVARGFHRFPAVAHPTDRA